MHKKVNNFLPEELIVYFKKKITSSEKVIFYSFLEKQAIFKNISEYELIIDNAKNKKHGLIIISKTNTFLLGNITCSLFSLSKDLQLKIKKTTILGKKNNVDNFIGNNMVSFKLLPKNFCFLKDKNLIVFSKHYKYLATKRQEDAEIFAKMKSSFIFEETGKKVNWKKLIYSIDRLKTLKVIFIKDKKTTTGMISSNFFSKEYATINLMYIKPKYRRKGYAKNLLSWYINFLLKKSKKITLFYSPENVSAKKLYNKLGFKKIENWIMAHPSKF